MANTAIQQATQQQTLTKKTGGKTMQDYIKQMEGEIKKALPAVITPERFTRIVLSALSTNPQLAKTTPQSFLGAMMTAAQLGMEPNTPLGQAYLIPYNRNIKGNDGKWYSVLECQFQLGYKGLIDLAYRSGDVSTIQAQVVYENDVFHFSYGLEPELKHTPASAERGKPVYVYAIFQTKDGGFGFEVMSMSDVRKHAERFSNAYKNGPWQSNFEEMAKKTVLKKVLKYAPLKSEFMRGVVHDETIKTEISDDMYMVEGKPIDEDTGEVIDTAIVDDAAEAPAPSDTDAPAETEAKK